MRTDGDPLVGLTELAAMLERHQGPDRPGPTRTAHRSVLRRRSTLVAVGALLLGSGLGFGAADRVTPSGEAAAVRIGLGFVPDSGWRVLQAHADAAPQRPAYAIAANVPLHPDDDSRGIQGSSGLPYATLLGLPPRGIVIVATFTVPQEEPWPREPIPTRSLPLRLRDASRYVETATRLRPGRPLGEYRLRARVGERDVDVHFYFGAETPTRAMIVAAQRQLDRLVVQPASRTAAKVEQRALPLQPAAPTIPVTALANVVDRTLACSTGVEGGAHNILPAAKSGWKDGGRFKWLGSISVDTPGHPLPTHPYHQRTLVGITAGWPPPVGTRSGAVGYDSLRCKPTRATVPLTARGLAGGPESVFGNTDQCLTQNTVLVRFRLTFNAPARLRLDGKRQWTGTTARIVKGEIAVRTPGGKQLVYLDVLESTGVARMLTRGCS